MKTRSHVLILCLLPLLLTAMIFLSSCQSDPAEGAFLTAEDLSGCELYIHNVTCSQPYEMRTVSDENFCDAVISLCAVVEKFRPIISTDIVLGESASSIILENDTTRYVFTFFDAEEQLSLDYVYRDSPMLAVGKSTIDENGNPHIDWSWYCSLTAAEYAELYEMVQTYVGGEIKN